VKQKWDRVLKEIKDLRFFLPAGWLFDLKEYNTPTFSRDYEDNLLESVFPFGQK